MVRPMPGTGGVTVNFINQLLEETRLTGRACRLHFSAKNVKESLGHVLIPHNTAWISFQSGIQSLLLPLHRVLSLVFSLTTFWITLTHFVSYSQEGQRCFGVRCFLERKTLYPGLLGTVLIYASSLCVIIYCSFLLIQCFFTIRCLHLDDKICDHLPYVVLYSSRT